MTVESPTHPPATHTLTCGKGCGRMEWSTLPIRDVPLDRIVFPCHDLDSAHVHATDGVNLSSGPIHLEQLLDGSLFVHDGRHRVLRAQQRGDRTIAARVA